MDKIDIYEPTLKPIWNEEETIEYLRQLKESGIISNEEFENAVKFYKKYYVHKKGHN